MCTPTGAQVGMLSHGSCTLVYKRCHLHSYCRAGGVPLLSPKVFRVKGTTINRTQAHRHSLDHPWKRGTSGKPSFRPTCSQLHSRSQCWSALGLSAWLLSLLCPTCSLDQRCPMGDSVKMQMPHICAVQGSSR